MKLYIKMRTERHIWYMVINVALCTALYMLATSAPTQGTTFAWLTASVIADLSSEVRFANVVLDVERSNSAEPRIYSFTTKAKAAQVDLIRAINFMANELDKDAIFSSWLNQYYFNYFDGEFLQPAATGMPITQFSVIRHDYNFINESTIPVNFKIDMPRTGGNSIALAAFWSINSNENFRAVAYDEVQNVYFIQEAIPSGEDFTVSFIAILLTNDSGSFAFMPEFAEMIQATNNAVHMVEGWKGIAVDIVPLHKYIRHGD